MFDKAWFDNFKGGITVCDPDGIIIYMNEKACEIWTKDGGKALLGRNLLDCHPEPSRTMLEEMLKNQGSNCYTTEKNGLKKLIYQAPVYDENKHFAGLVEMILELPGEMPHFIR